MKFLKALFAGNSSTINGQEAIDMIKKNPKMLILDVRTKDEFKTGSIPKAINIPVGDLASKLSSIQKHKDNKILVYCASGMRSKRALGILKDNKFENVFNLAGGIGSYIRNS